MNHTPYDADQRTSKIREWVLNHYKPTRLEAVEIPGYTETVIRSHEQR